MGMVVVVVVVIASLCLTHSQLKETVLLLVVPSDLKKNVKLFKLTKKLSGPSMAESKSQAPPKQPLLAGVTSEVKTGVTSEAKTIVVTNCKIIVGLDCNGVVLDFDLLTATVCMDNMLAIDCFEHVVVKYD